MCIQIGDEGGRPSEGIESEYLVTKIHVDGNKIGDEGAKAIGEALKVNTSLTEIDLAYNEIGDKGERQFQRH